jgi:hypothetical protein
MLAALFGKVAAYFFILFSQTLSYGQEKGVPL